MSHDLQGMRCNRITNPQESIPRAQFKNNQLQKLNLQKVQSDTISKKYNIEVKRHGVLFIIVKNNGQLGRSIWMLTSSNLKAAQEVSKRFWTRYKHSAEDFIQHFCHSSVLHFLPPPPCLNEPKASRWISVAQQSLSKQQWNLTLWETGIPPARLWLYSELSQQLRTTRKLLILTLFSTTSIRQPHSKHSPCCPHSPPGDDKGANAWQMFVSHEMLQQGVQCQVLDRPAQLLLQQPVTGHRVQCREQDCIWGLLHQGSLWQIEVSGHQMHPGQPMDALPTPQYFCACAERLKWPLQWGYRCLLYSWDFRG